MKTLLSGVFSWEEPYNRDYLPAWVGFSTLPYGRLLELRRANSLSSLLIIFCCESAVFWCYQIPN